MSGSLHPHVLCPVDVEDRIVTAYRAGLNDGIEITKEAIRPYLQPSRRRRTEAMSRGWGK